MDTKPGDYFFSNKPGVAINYTGPSRDGFFGMYRDKNIPPNLKKQFGMSQPHLGVDMSNANSDYIKSITSKNPRTGKLTYNPAYLQQREGVPDARLPGYEQILHNTSMAEFNAASKPQFFKVKNNMLHPIQLNMVPNKAYIPPDETIKLRNTY